MKALQILFFVILVAFLSGCAGMNLSGGGVGKHGAGFISADGRGMAPQRQGHPGYYGGQPMMIQGQSGYGGQPMPAYGQPMMQQGYGQPMPMYGQSMPVYQGGYGGHGGGVYTAPCQPFNADGLMAWAKGAGPSTHSRSANVSNNNGRVNCYSSESASSSGTSQQQYGQPVMVQGQSGYSGQQVYGQPTPATPMATPMTVR